MKKQSQRPRLPAVSEEMKAWSLALGEEVGGWPRVRAKSFFGLTAFYRSETIFALLPRTRAMESPNSLAFKFEAPTAVVRNRLEADPRVGSLQMQNVRWFSFEVSSDTDLHDALDWLGRAYQASGKKKKSK